MRSDQPGPRSRRRIALEVAALGALVIGAVMMAQVRDEEPSDETAPAETEAEPGTVETPTPAPVTIPSAPESWKAMSHDELEAVGRHAAEITRGFRFERVQVFSGGGQTNAIAVLVHERTELEFSLIPPGSFLMGSPETEEGRGAGEYPQRRADIGRPFLLARTECTTGAWTRGAGATPTTSEAAEALPVVDVSWTGARAWCDGSGLRLPSEAEWEYACRAGTTTAYWAGDDETDLASAGWYGGNSGGELHSAAQKPANPFGLHDVNGNVWEWCEDTWRDSHESAPRDGAAWVHEDSEYRVVRGAGWTYPAEGARSGVRGRNEQSDRCNDLGFRPAATVGGK